MADLLEASVTLASDPVSVSESRSFVVDTLAEWGLATDTDEAETIRLIVSELATNAVQHTSGQSPTFTVYVALHHDGRLRLGVTDSHPRFPKRLPAAVQQDNGRGMVIVRWLTAERGGWLRVRPTREGGKTVSVELPWHGASPRTRTVAPTRAVTEGAVTEGTAPAEAVAVAQGSGADRHRGGG